MYGYEDYYNEQIYKPTPLDELLMEYREKCKTILLASVQSEIDNIRKNNDLLKEENNKLRNEIRQLKDEVKLLKDKCKNSLFIDLVSSNITKENFTDFLSVIYKKDYREPWSEEETPLWLGVLTEYYSHKDEIIELFNIFNIKTPSNINNFRLPNDWSEEELDIFFDTMINHYNCNNNSYQYNLRFWGTNSLKPVKEQCNKNYSEIPWQYVLRNPLLRKEKYLKLMGQKMTEPNGDKFAKIYCYQDLNENEVKTILDNIDYTKLVRLQGDIGSFILKHIHLIDSDDFLDKIYPFIISGGYSKFNYVKKMKSKHIKRYLLEHKKEALGLLKENMNLSKEDKQELVQLLL